MKDPDETIRKMREFTRKIHTGYFRVNFLFHDGYYNFIDDLKECAQNLVIACDKQLADAGKPIDETI